MNPKPPKTKKADKRQLLREIFINAFSIALLKEAVLVPVRAEARNYRRDEIPEYYRG